MKDRVQTLIKALNFTAAQFADEIGVQKSGISHILSGRNNPSLDFVQKILARFPEINLEWLIMGKGAMMKNEIQRQLAAKEPEIFTAPESVNRPPDLFSFEIPDSREPKSGQKATESLVNQEKESVISSETGNAPTDVPPEKTALVTGPKPEIPQGGSEKEVYKVLFIYTDKTFEEFRPG